jgi:hypothetical protein
MAWLPSTVDDALFVEPAEPRGVVHPLVSVWTPAHCFPVGEVATENSVELGLAEVVTDVRVLGLCHVVVRGSCWSAAAKRIIMQNLPILPYTSGPIPIEEAFYGCPRH